MKKALIILQILLVSFGLLGQDRGVLISVGGAGFRMDDLKYYLEQNLNSYPVEGKIVNSFPPYSSLTINYLRQFMSMLRIGAGYGYTSAGARSDYSDYSGNITTDILASSHRIGAFASYSVLGGEHIDLALYGRLDANFTRVEISNSIYVLGFYSGNSDKYKSVSPNTSAGFELMYHLRNFTVGIDAGYLVDVPGKLSETGSGSNLLDPADHNRILKSDWTGWRAGFRAIIWLNQL